MESTTPRNAIAVAVRRPPFHQALDRLRQRRGLSFRELGERVGQPRAEVERWCRGETVPTPPVFSRLCNVAFRELRPYRPDLAMRWELDGHEIAEPAATAIAQAAYDAAETELNAELAMPLPPLPAFAITFGEALRRARVIEGLSQEELAELIGCTSQAVGHWEGERNAPVRETYQKLIDLFPVLESCIRPTTLDIPMPDGGRGEPRADTGGGDKPAAHFELPRLVPGSRIGPPPGVPTSIERAKDALRGTTLRDLIETPRTAIEQAALDHVDALMALAKARAEAAPAQDAVKAARIAFEEAAERANAAYQAVSVAEGNVAEALARLHEIAGLK